jgi:apolipoprotein D and lipocalin family protein
VKSIEAALLLVAAITLATVTRPALAQRNATQPSPGSVTPVDSVDLDRYAGRWYEVARFPNSFQSDCAGETVAEYERLSNGQIRVVNSCRQADGTMKRAEGRAKLADRDGPTSKLKVRFAPAFLSFLPMVWGKYWVLDLTDDYSAALVGEPGRKYLWVLSRTPIMPDSTYRRMVDTAERQGFDVRRLQRSPAPRDSVPSEPSPSR